MKYIILSFLLLTSLPAWAQTPIPSEHPMKEVEQQLKSKKAKNEKLQGELKDIKHDVESQRKKLVTVAKRIKGNEQQLSQLEQNIAVKQIEQNEIEDKLIEDKKSISDLVLALERIRRVPPEAIISRPETPFKTAQSSMLLQSILPRIYKRADQLKTNLEKLNLIIVSMENDKSDALKISQLLKEEEKSLSTLLKQRENAYASTEKNVKQEQIELAQISKQARSLKELVAKIEEKQAREDKRRKELASQPRAEKQNVAIMNIPHDTPVPSAGQAQLPVSGIMTVGYGKTDDIGAISQGIKIKSRPNALIVAPMGGVVDYAGTFKGYGQIIILKHQKGYHSLIAGLGKIDTVVGRAVSAGEPIGKMPSSDAQILYYELRYQGQPVNPSKKISGLK